MAKFTFNLEVVMKERKRQEEKKLQEWTLSKRILDEMKLVLTETEQRLKLAFDEATELASLPLNQSAQFGIMESFIKGLKAKIIRKTGEIERATKFTEKKRQEFVLASQKFKALEKLREKKLEEFMDKIRKRELKRLDDIYVMRGSRKEDEVTQE